MRSSRLLSLIVSAILAGCQAQQPVSDTRVQVSAASTAKVAVQPAYVSGSVRQLMAAMSPYTQASINHMVVKLFTVTAGPTETQVAQVDVPAAQLGQTITFGNLAHNTNYRIRAYAYKASGTAPAAQISIDASSFVDVGVGTDDAPPLGNLIVSLIDQTFSGSTSSDGLMVNGGSIVHAGSETLTVNQPPAFGTTLDTYAIGDIAYGSLAVSSDGSFWIGSKASATNDRSLVKVAPDGTKTTISGYYLNPVIDSQGNVWVSNYGGGSVAKFTASGSLIGTYAVGSYPSGSAFDGAGNLWVANYNPSGTVTKLSPSGSTLGTFNVGTYPHDIAFDQAGNAWVLNAGDGTITKLAPNGAVISNFLVKSPSGGGPQDIAFDSDGFAWVTGVDDYELWPAFRKVNSSGVTVQEFRLNTDSLGIAITSNGTKYITSESGHALMKVSPAGAILGQVSIGWPSYGVAIGLDGSIYVANYEPGVVYRLAP